jgi:thiamine-phosphate pyrophosphorylase
MPLKPQKPLIYLITSGETGPTTTPATEDFSQVLKLVEAAVAAKVDLVQLREKNLSARVLFELAKQAAQITCASDTRLLINDRADIALAAKADGVHLTTRSIGVRTIRRTFGINFLIGVSTHSLDEVRLARNETADFAVFGPVFPTVSKQLYGEAVGLEKLRQAASELRPFPILALGGVSISNAGQCFLAGASGVAAIRLLNKAQDLQAITRELRQKFAEIQQ